MKTRILIATGMLLTLGSALAGTLMYGHEKPQTEPVSASQEMPTPYTIAMWKATARSADFAAPKVPR